MIVEIQGQSNGAHRNQSITPENVPDGWIEVPAELESTVLPLLPFVNLTINNGSLAVISDNAIARAAQKAADDAAAAAVKPSDPVTQIQLALADLAEAQEKDKTETELALAELAGLVSGGES